MSEKYVINEFPQNEFYFRLYDNVKKLDWKAIQKEEKCYAIMNLAYFAMTNVPSKGVKAFDHQSAIMFAGKWGLKYKYHEYGICIDKDGRLTLGTEVDAVYDYAVALPPSVINGKAYNTSYVAKNGATYIGIKADNTPVFLMSDKSDGLTSTQAISILQEKKCVHILRWDGSWSTRGTLGNGLTVNPSQYRCDRSYILVFKRTPDNTSDSDTEGENTMNKKYIVLPDIGLNIRKEADADSVKVGGYSKGTIITVLEEKDGWGRTNQGWVKMAFVSAAENGTDTNPVPDTSAPTKRVTDTGITIQQDFVAVGRKNRPAKPNPGLYITIHETGNFANGADAKAHAAYLKGNSAVNAMVSWQYTVDDHSICHHIPDSESAYHAGDGANGTGNLKSIGIEICVNKDGDFEKAKANAAALVRLLLKEHNLFISDVKQHYNWNSKNCPQTIRNTIGGWDAFLDMCGNSQSNIPTDDTQQASPFATEAWEKAIRKKVLDGTNPRNPLTREQAAVVLDRLGLLN